MRILLTNDDGIESPGLRELARALGGDHEVWVVAPESNRSGSSHSITLGNPARFRRVGEREFASAGTPADCVLYAILGVVPAPIDIVLSGINLGPNLGTDIVYSGTAAAARQGAFMRKPSVAVSLSSYKAPYHLELPVSCDEAGAVSLLRAFLAAAVSNQAAYALTPGRSGRMETE